ncbi:MAG: AAA family ATPase, partial [Chloroflexota bacterium]
EATHGYSGGPIWQPEWGRVIGMVKEGLTADEMGKHGNTTLGVPVEVLAEHCPSRLTLTPPESLIVQATRHISGAVEDLLDEYTAMVFVGRDDSLDALDAWLEEDESGRYVVTALAGFGKTSLLAHWLRRRQRQGDPGPNDQVAYHFFSQRFDVTRPVANLYANLLGQIADFEGQYDLTLPDEDRRPALLRRLIEERDPDADRRLIIVIDALDEAQNAFQLSLPDPLPPGVFLLVSARAGDWQAGAPQPRFLAPWTEGARGRHLHELSRPAIQTWLRLAADGALERWWRDEAFVGRFANKTRGLPLYASYLIEDLIAAGDDAPGYLERAPRRFEAYISQQVDRFDELELPDEAYEFLSLLAVSPGAFHKDELGALLGLRDRQIRRLRNLRDVARWLRVSEDEMFAFAHPLLAEGFAIALEDDAADAREKLLAWCAAWPEHRSPYVLRHYAELLAQDKRWAALSELALDRGYAQAQQEQLPAEPDLPLRTVRLALEEAGRSRQPAMMARLLLEHARRVRQVRRLSPLEAQRLLPGQAGLDRAWQLAEAHEYSRRVLWFLLLATEQADGGREGEAAATLARLARRPLSFLDHLWSEPAAWLLLDLLDSQSSGTMPVLKAVAADDQKSEIVRTLTVGGRWSEAREVALSIGDPEDRTQALLTVAEARLRAGYFQAGQELLGQALDAFRTIGNQYTRWGLVERFITAQTAAGEEGAVLTGLVELRRAAGTLKDGDDQAEFYRLIAFKQIQLGDYEAALQTAGLSDAEVLAELAAAQMERGQHAAALETIGQALTLADREGHDTSRWQLIQRLMPDTMGGPAEKAALALARAVEDAGCRAQWLSTLAARTYYDDRPEIARALCVEAFTAAQEMMVPADKGAMLCEVAECALEIKADQSAGSIIEAAVEAAKEVVDSDQRAPLLVRLVDMQGALGAYEDALDTALLNDESVDRADTLDHILRAMIDNEPEQLNRPLIERIAAEASQLEVPLPGEALLSSLVAALIQIEALPLAWQAAAQIKDEQARAENLKDIVWLAPVVDQGAAVSMALQLEDDNLRQELLADAVRRLIDLGQLAGAQEVFQRLAEGGQREYIRDELLDAWLASGDYGQAQALARRGSDALRQVQQLIEVSQAQHRAGLLGQAGATCDLAREIADAMEPGR